MSVQSFANRWLGKKTDYDKVYEYQCVDLILQYLHEEQGISSGVWGNAIDYWNKPNTTLLKYYSKVKTAKIKTGDIVILGPTRTNKFGHIGIAVDGVKMLEQNGYSGDGDGANGDEIRYRVVPLDRVVGVLRKKDVEGVIMKPTRTEVGNAFNYLGVSDKDVPEEKYKYYTARRENVLYQNVLKALYDKFKDQRTAKDIARAELAEVKNKLQEALNKPPETITKEVRKIVEVTVGEEEAVRGFFKRLIDRLVFWNK